MKKGMLIICGIFLASTGGAQLEIGSHRELFVDYYLIDSLTNADLSLQTPVDEGSVMFFDQPWEGAEAGAYATVVKDDDVYRLYYRGLPSADGLQVACYAESSDGINWIKPNLGLFEVNGTTNNNVILTNSHAFAPFIDTKPGIPDSERYKGIDVMYEGSFGAYLAGYVSADGIHWIKAYDPLFSFGNYAFDSLNVAFYSEAEQQYVCYFRQWLYGTRRIRRATGSSFTNLVDRGLMEYAYYGESVPLEHHYINGTFPYFRAPHTYIALAARYVPDGGGEVAPEQVEPLGIDPDYYEAAKNDNSYAIFMSTRPGTQIYDRPFPHKYIEPAPEIGPQMARSNYAAHNAVQTGPAEMSFYVDHNYASSISNHLRRYSLRLDGFAAVSATNGVGEMVTNPLVFEGNRLCLNYLVRTGGSLRVEIQNTDGIPVPGYALSDAVALTGDAINEEVHWTQGSRLDALEGLPIRLRFVLDDADLFAMQFGFAEPAAIAGFYSLRCNTIKMLIDLPLGARSEYYPEAATNLAGGSWFRVPHSDDGWNSFMVTNLNYSSTDTNGNALIYLEADKTNKFFRVIAE